MFSHMNYIKSKYRTSLTDNHLADILRMSITNLQPRFKDIVKTSNARYLINYLQFYNFTLSIMTYGKALKFKVYNLPFYQIFLVTVSIYFSMISLKQKITTHILSITLD